MNRMQLALIKKDIRNVTSNSRLLSVLLIVPLVMTVVLPSIFVLIIAFNPDGASDIQALLDLLPGGMPGGDPRLAAIDFVINSIIPLFFLMVPVMASSVMAASSFVGEKEKRTLETLLYAPLSLRQIFQAKILASLLLGMAVTALSFVVMAVVVELEVYLALGSLVSLNANWPVLLLLVSPAICMVAITITVRGSAKARTVEESQQRSSFLVFPIVALLMGQFSGLLMINTWVLLAIGAALAVLAVLLVRRAYRSFTYESLLQNPS